MDRIWRNTLTSIILLIVLSFVCALLVLSLNILLPAKTSFFNLKKIQSVAPADSYYKLTASDFEEFDVSLDAFNQNYQAASIRSVFRATGGENDGCYIVEAEGLGYQDVYAVILYIAYNHAGEISGIVELSVQGNSYWGELEPLLPDLYASLIGKSGNVGGASDLITGKTGATQSLNGIARAVNISNAFIVNLVGELEKEPYEVTDEAFLERLQLMTSEGLSFIAHPFEVSESTNTVHTLVNAVYVSSNDDIIFETQSDHGGFGSARLLVLVDTENYSVIAVDPISMGARDYGEYVTEFLNDPKVLTEIFGGLNVEQINSLDKYLNGSTGATQTSDGLKAAVISALNNIDSFLDYYIDYTGGVE